MVELAVIVRHVGNAAEQYALKTRETENILIIEEASVEAMTEEQEEKLANQFSGGRLIQELADEDGEVPTDDPNPQP
jgi:hypothetical protein